MSIAYRIKVYQLYLCDEYAIERKIMIYHLVT